MFKVTTMNDIESDTEVKIIASYKGYEHYTPELDRFAGDIVKVRMTDNTGEVNVLTTGDQFGNTQWWYPSYSVYVPDDSKSVQLHELKLGSEYKVMRDLRLFSVNPYRRILPNYKALSTDQIFSNYAEDIMYEYNYDVVVVQIIKYPGREEYNDIIALCITTEGKFIYVPITVLYGRPVPQYRPKKFVYEYRQWKDS